MVVFIFERFLLV